MSANVEKIVQDFLSESAGLMERVDELPYSTAAELYDMLDVMAKTACKNIKTVNPEFRAEICARQDAVLERIIDTKPSDTVLNNKPNGVYTPATDSYRRWKNVELLKDKGLTGYLLAKTIGAKPVMYFCAEQTEYPYLDVLPGLEVLYQDAASSGSAEIYYEHLLNEYQKMDVIIFHGMYAGAIDFLNAYRKLRPDGKIYCGLDMNRHWMARYEWSDLRYKEFSEQCDIIATSCSSLRDALNKNSDVRFPCRWLPNGFYNPSNTLVTADANVKKNIILTVGRIGTEQKNNLELMVAFALASEKLNGWTLRFVGPVEPNFQAVIEQFFALRPNLKNRVIFTGAIVNREDLYKEYAQAKIFALTSTFEGFPNVYAEALFHGCMFVTSDIDAADDMTGHGDFGIKYTLGDTNALATALTQLSRKTDKKELTSYIPKALKYAEKYFCWIRNAKKLAYMLYRG